MPGPYSRKSISLLLLFGSTSIRSPESEPVERIFFDGGGGQIHLVLEGRIDKIAVVIVDLRTGFGLLEGR